MEIKKENQFNQGVSKYKVLSSNAGVGAIVATKWGGFVMPISSSDWGFVREVELYIAAHPTAVYKDIASDTATEIVEDSRFVQFLKDTEGMTKLKCLVAIPHIGLTPNNVCDVAQHPLNMRYKQLHNISIKNWNLPETRFTIPAIVFPRWFYSRKTYNFRPIEEWMQEWQINHCNDGKLDYFAPPRDPSIETKRTMQDERLKDNSIYGLLEQVSMVLICSNGHISDIPWDKYFAAKLEVPADVNKEGFDLFNYAEKNPCQGKGSGGKHQLQWLESRNHAESFGRLKCRCCGESVSLEGIMNLQPRCPGDKPWEGVTARDEQACKKPTGEPATMKWAMVTSNSVYYAESFSSLFIPKAQKSPELQAVLTLMETKWYDNYQKKHPNATREDYINANSVEDLAEKADDSNHSVSVSEMKDIINSFLGVGTKSTAGDVREQYRFEEFEVFRNNKVFSDKKLGFADIDLPKSLKPYFTKIQQVSALAMSSTQINFSRVLMPQPQLNDDGTVEYPHCMKIFRGNPDDVTVMPAIQSFGEGLFFIFSDKALKEWEEEHRTELEKHYASISNHDETYENIYQKMKKGGIAKFFLLHTFSHIIMKELEFSCGYPTASLSERLYFSDRMCGVLIYTTDGAEGSMGGLVWQGQPTLIEDIIRKAMHRAINCASDPICWENDEQINFAACFSCAMVSETSCEERNVGLDRRVLVDENYGFFAGLL